MTASKRRAVTDKQKQEREQALIDAAWTLYQESSYESVSVASVAQAAGLAKGTVYLYFSTKEELFLAVLGQHLCEWFESLREKLDRIGECEVDTLADYLGESLKGRWSMLRLFAIVHAILERNVEYDAAYRFKKLILDQLTLTGVAIHHCIPDFAMGQIMQSMLYIYALIIGMQQIAEPAPVARQVISENPEMAVFNIDYTEALSAAAANLLRGMAKSEM
ncbi:MAG: TetR family transcriptional regulator [Anaerolineae bacterium]|nr:TetR family transcriptional regulator [Anaerolineae bacterium]